jgi:hypothetical protein
MEPWAVAQLLRRSHDRDSTVAHIAALPSCLTGWCAYATSVLQNCLRDPVDNGAPIVGSVGQVVRVTMSGHLPRLLPIGATLQLDGDSYSFVPHALNSMG